MQYDVVIAGGGPVGLFLAFELRLADVSVVVLEQAESPAAPLKRMPFGMRGLSAPTIEAFYRRGLLSDVAAAQPAIAASAQWLQQARRPAGHFAGIQFYLDDVDTSKWSYRLPSPAGTNLALELQSLETLLAARATAMGVEIFRGAGVESFEVSDNDVTVRTGVGTFCGSWLVGCDGGRSTVRRAGGFEFEGTDPEFTGYSVEVELADPDRLRVGRTYTATGMYTYARPGTIAMVDFDGGTFHRTAPIALEHVQTVLRRISCTGVTVTALKTATTWTDRAFLATTYRKDRVLLAGDAAHIHSPLGGQGLNLGLGDAMNLGWKLAATIRGDAPAGLLDSYWSERHPIAERVLDWSRAQVSLMRPSRSSRALAAIIRDLIDTRDGATYFAERVWAISLRYEIGETHPLAGRSAPDFMLKTGASVGELLGAGKGLFLDFRACASFHDLANQWSDRVTYIASNAEEQLGLSALLIRPDGIVGWAAGAAPDRDEATRAFQRWFGRPK